MHQKTCFCGKLKIKTPARPLLVLSDKTNLRRGGRFCSLAA